MSHYASFVVRRRYAVVAAWVAIVIAGLTLLPDVERSRTGTLGDLVPTEAAAIDTEVRSVELFSFPVLSRTVVVERGQRSLDLEQVRRIYARAAVIDTEGLPGLESIVFALAVTDNVFAGRPDRAARAALTYLYFPPEIGPVGRTGLAERLVDRFVARPGVEAGVTGAVPARGEQIRAITDALPTVELATLAIITLAVGLFFRSLVAPLANLFAVATAYLASVRLVGGLGQAVGISIPEEVEPVMVALLFGVVTDYFIFFASRFRRMVAEGEGPLRAAERATVSLTPIILTAGLSVAAASAALVVAQLGFFRAFGPGLALAVLVAVAVVLTLVPALLAILGRRLLWPSRAAGPSPAPAIPVRLARLRAALGAARNRVLSFPVDHPRASSLLIGLPLLGLAAAAGGLNFANTQISGLPDDSPAKEAFRMAARDFPPGAIAPTMVLVEQPGIGVRERELDHLHRLLAARRNVAEVIGPAYVPDRLDFGATTSPGGEAVRHLLVLDTNPFGARAINTIARLREDLPGMLERAGLSGAEASLAGDTALSEETVRKTSEDLVRIVPVAALAVLLVLAVFLRALVAPLYLVAASLLSLAATLGLTVLVFQDFLGYGEITFYVPFAGIVLLIALGSDYNVYLVGRVWAEARRRELREAVRVAGARATSAITVAGLVLALSFAALFLVPTRPFSELAFLLSAGLLIDAFLVRALLAPALISLFGHSSGWPGRALKHERGRPGWKDEGEVREWDG